MLVCIYTYKFLEAFLMIRTDWRTLSIYLVRNPEWKIYHHFFSKMFKFSFCPTPATPFPFPPRPPQSTLST